MSIYKLIDRLGLVVEESQSIPWTSYKLVNIEKFYDQLELVMSKLPQEIKEATSILNQKEEILSQAQTKAEKVLKESEEMRKKAYDEAENVRIGSDQYAESVLTSLDQDLSNALSIVRNGQKHLTSNKQRPFSQIQTNGNGREKETAII